MYLLADLSLSKEYIFVFLKYLWLRAEGQEEAGTRCLQYVLLARVLRLILSLEPFHLWFGCRLACLEDSSSVRGNCYFFLYLLGLGDFQHSKLQLWGDICQSLQCTFNPSLCRMRVWATILIFPTSVQVEEASRGMCCWRNAHKFHGMKL